MHNKFLKPILLTLLLSLSACSDTRDNKKENSNTAQTTKKKDFDKPPYDDRLNQHEYGRIWYDTSAYDYESAYNIAVFYDEKYKAYDWAEFWYKRSWELKKTAKTANNLGYLYEDINKLSDSIKWFKKGIERESLNSFKNLSLLYYNKLKNEEKAVEYMIALIDKKYPKEKVLGLFREHWKLSEETIKKGYEAQLKSKIIPEKLKYKGGL